MMSESIAAVSTAIVEMNADRQARRDHPGNRNGEPEADAAPRAKAAPPAAPPPANWSPAALLPWNRAPASGH